jgi:hypothetical protein
VENEIFLWCIFSKFGARITSPDLADKKKIKPIAE